MLLYDGSSHFEEESDQANDQKLKYLRSTTDVSDILENIAEYELTVDQLLISLAKLGSTGDIITCAELIAPPEKTKFLRLLIAEQKERIDREISSNLALFIHPDNRASIFELLLEEADYLIFSNIRRFKDIDNDRLQADLIKSGRYTLLATNIDLFENIDRVTLAAKLMESVSGLLVLSEKIEEFPDLDKYTFVEKLVESGLESKIYEVVEKIVDQSNSQELTDLLLKSGRYGVIVKFASLFPSANFSEIYTNLVREKKAALILNNPQLFPKIDWDELYQILIQDKTKPSFLKIIEHAENFPNLNLNELAKQIYYAYGSEIIERHISLFIKQDVKEFEKALFAANATVVIVRNLDLFPTVDLQKLAKSLIKQKNYYEIVSNINKFPFIDKLALAKVLIKSDRAKMIFYETEFLKTIDPQELLVLLLRQGSFQELLENCQIFPNLNLNQVLSTLVTIKGGRYLIKKHLPLFIKNNQTETVRILSENGHLDVISEHIDEFPNLDIEAYFKKAIETEKLYIIIALAHKLDRAGHETIFRQIVEHKQRSQKIQSYEEYVGLVKFYTWKKIISPELFQQYLHILDQHPTQKNNKSFNFIDAAEEDFDEGIHPELIAEEIPSVMKKLERLDERQTLRLIHICKNDQLYKSLYVIIKTKNYDATKVGMTWREVEKKLLRLSKNQNFEFAADLLRCAQLLFKTHQVELHNWQQILEKNQVVKEVPKRSRFEHMDTLKEFFTYYLTVVLIKNHSVAKLPTGEFSQISTAISALFHKIKEYLVMAVLSEIEHDEESERAMWFKNPSIYQSYSDQEMRVFFEMQAKRFKNKNLFPKNSGFGGDVWGFIAELGESFWNSRAQADLSQQIALINIAIGTQHHTGYFFDKDGTRVKLSNDELKEFLDFEASQQHTLESLLEYGMENELIGAEEYQHYINLQQKLSQKTKQGESDLDPDKIYHKAADKKIQETIRDITENPSLPAEIKAYVQSIYSKTDGFTQNATGHEYLGRLLKTMQIDWNKSDEQLSYYKKNEHELYYLNVEGYDLAFWYVNGELKNIKDVKALHENKSLLSEATDTVIVRAMLGTVREGD